MVYALAIKLDEAYLVRRVVEETGSPVTAETLKQMLTQ